MLKPITTEDSFIRSAGKQLALYGLVAVLAITVLMYGLNWLASLTSSGNSGVVTAIDVERNEIGAYLRNEPPQLDTMQASDQISGTVLEHVMEGLIRYDGDNNVLPGLAERWQIEGTKATFWIRPEARWSNGEPVTAHDFAFAWKNALDPATGSRYAFIFFPIKNAEAANNGELPLDAIGVTALDAQTLVVELERPLAYLEKLLAFVTFKPVQQAFYESTLGRYGADADELLYSGPFVIASWIHGSSMRLEKNPYYWDSDRIKLDAINFGYMTPDSSTLLNLYKDGRIATVDLTAEMLEGAMQQRWHLDSFMDGSVFFVDFNHREGRLTGNKNLRMALILAQDGNELVDKVIKLPGYLPAKSLFPVWLQGVERTFREEYPAPEYPYNVQLARQYLELAKKELGLQEFPPLVLLSGDPPVAVISAQYYQQVYKKNLGLDIVIDTQVFQQRIQKMNEGDFDLVLNGWGPDYNDPMTFADLYASWNLNNRGEYSNPELDEQVRIAQGSLDPTVRMDAFGAIQQIIHDEAIFIGNYERGLVFATDPRLKGAHKRIFGAEIDFTGAYIDAAE